MNVRRPGSPACSQRGQGTIEFQIISVLVLLPLLMGVVQVGLLIVAKNTLNVATLGAARAGAASGGDRAAMKSALAMGLVALHGSAAKTSRGIGMSDLTNTNYLPVMTTALINSTAANALYSDIIVLNPSASAFADFGVKNAQGTVIPMNNVYDNAAVGARSGQTRAEALLLKIEVHYCEEMIIPLIKDMIQAGLSVPLGGTVADYACYAAGRVPLSSQAIVRMTVAPVQEKLK